jgi:hypothetical protein
MRAELFSLNDRQWACIAPHQDEVCGFKLHPPDPIGFIESIY